MRKISGKKIFWLLVIILFLYFFIQLFLPGYVSRQIRQAIEEDADSISNLEVHVSAFPAWKLLFLRADNAIIKADEIVVEGFTLHDIRAYYDDLYIENNRINGENTDLNIVIKEDNLNSYLSQQDTGIEQLKVILNPEQIFLEGYIMFFDSSFNLQLTGNINLEKNNVVKFIPENIKIEDFSFSRVIMENIIKDLDLGFTLELEQLNFPVNLEQIKIEAGQIRILSGVFAGEAGS